MRAEERSAGHQRLHPDLGRGLGGTSAKSRRGAQGCEGPGEGAHGGLGGGDGEEPKSVFFLGCVDELMTQVRCKNGLVLDGFRMAQLDKTKTSQCS